MKRIQTGLRPFFSFYGGKWRCAPYYPKPIFGTIIEAFAGSAGYSLRYPSLKVHLYDIDPVICGIWDYCIHAKEEEVLSLPIQFEDIRNLHIPQEARWLLGFWVNKGVASPCNMPSKWMRNALPGQLGTYWGEKVRQRIASQMQHIRHWTISQVSFESISFPGPATWFIDPPYSGRCGRMYKYDKVDYCLLASWVGSRNGCTIVCEQSGADWLPFKPFKTIKATEGKHGKHVSHEIIWTKGFAEVGLEWPQPSSSSPSLSC